MKYLLSAGLLFCSFVLYSQTQMTFSANIDNTIFEEDTTLSNGMGIFFFAGNTANSFARRALVRFELNPAIPTNATVDSVVLTLHCSKSTGTDAMNVHLVTSDWGEGASAAGGNEGGGAPAALNDATWSANFFTISTWNNLGGDFNPTASASISTNEGSTEFISSALLSADVQGWVDGSSPNNGWMLIGNETASRTALRFNSRQNTVDQPMLDVFYTVPPDPCLVNADTLSGIVGSGTYTYGNGLFSDGTIETMSTVVFDAKNFVELTPSFEVQINADLEVSVQPCP